MTSRNSGAKAPHIHSDPWQAFALLESLRRELAPENRVTFSASVGMGFAPGPVHRLEWNDGNEWRDLAELIALCAETPAQAKAAPAIAGLRLALPYMGLAGMNGPLPLPVTELVNLQLRGHNTGLADFIDLLQTPLLRLLFEKLVFIAPELAPAEPPASQHYANPFYAVAGVLVEGLRGVRLHTPGPGPETGMFLPHQPRPAPVLGSGHPLSHKALRLERAATAPPPEHTALDASSGMVPDALFLACAPLWAQRPRSAAGLEKLVASLFGIPARVVPFRGAWLPLEETHRTRLGGWPFRVQPSNTPEEAREKTAKHRHSGQNCLLGETVLLGSAIWDSTAAFTLRLGPLSREQRRDFLPPPAGRLRGRLMAVVRWYTGDEVACVVETVPLLPEQEFHDAG